jgi:ABC-type glycerol-3-phosphate transport system permease component
VLRDIGFNLISLLLVSFFALPVFYVVSGAFMSRAEVYAGALLPARLQLENLRIALVEYKMTRYFLNSLLFTTSIVGLNLLFCSLTGYALAKFEFPGKRVLFTLVLVSMMIPSLVLIVPLFIEVSYLGWLNKPIAVIAPAFLDPFGVFLMRQYIVDISDEHLDAARVEGCSEFGIFWKIVIPFSMPALFALTLYRFMYVWNDLFWPLLVLGGERWRPLSVAVQQFGARYFAAQELQLTTSFVAALPMLLILVFTSRHVFNAISRTGGLKI